MNFLGKNSVGTHTVLIYWSEPDNCFIAEAPDCLMPMRPGRDVELTALQAPFEPLQGRGASHAKALADALRRLEKWTDFQLLASTEPVSHVSRPGPLSVARGFLKQRSFRIAVWLVALIASAAVFATIDWSPAVRSPAQFGSKIGNVPPKKAPAVLPPPAASATTLQSTPSPIEEAPPQLVVGDAKISVDKAVAGAPRSLSLALPWDVMHARVDEPPLLNLSCTLIRSGTEERKAVRTGQPQSYEICRVPLSSGQHELTIELPDGIPAGGYRLQLALGLANEVPQLVVRELRIP